MMGRNKIEFGMTHAVALLRGSSPIAAPEHRSPCGAAIPRDMLYHEIPGSPWLSVRSPRCVHTFRGMVNVRRATRRGDRPKGRSGWACGGDLACPRPTSHTSFARGSGRGHAWRRSPPQRACAPSGDGRNAQPWPPTGRRPGAHGAAGDSPRREHSGLLAGCFRLRIDSRGRTSGCRRCGTRTGDSRAGRGASASQRQLPTDRRRIPTRRRIIRRSVQRIHPLSHRNEAATGYHTYPG